MSKFYKVMLVIQEEVLAKSEAEALRFVLRTAHQAPQPLVEFAIDELPMGTGDIYSDEEE